MNITKPCQKVRQGKWSMYKYNLISALGENGQRLSGCREHIDLSRRAACEGMVLLENNGLLPLRGEHTVALFGIGTLDYIASGGGSGMVYPAYTRNVYEGFAEKAPRIKIYEPLTRYYYDKSLPLLGSSKTEYDLLPEIELPAELVADAAKNADTAIITIRRHSGEFWDRSADKGDFYLTDLEQKMVDEVTSAFDHCVAVLDVGGMVDVSWIKNNPKIDAALLAWQAGMEGGLAIADIICGDANPCGKLVDTFAKEFSDYPSADTFNESEDYVDYFEDIYVGYRFFETIPGAADRVNYPFGYGLSYTSFDISAPEAAQKGGCIEVKCSVTNTGHVAGKEVVQIYYSAPQGKLGKPKVELAAFKKTALLAPGDSEDICLSFMIKDMASYDDLGKCQMSAYVLEKGEYRFFAGSDCRTLREAAYRYTVEDEFVVVQQLEQNCAPNQLTKRMLADGSFEPLPCFPVKEYRPEPYVNTASAPARETPWQLIDVHEGKITLDEFISQLTDDELITLVSGIPKRGVSDTAGMGGIERVGIPPIVTTDGPAGVRLFPDAGLPTTAWPCATLIACTWDPDIMYAIGAAGAMEAKENGLGVWLTPALNIHRNPLCGRNFEYFSEDPLLAGKFAAAKVKGIQSRRVAASAKHFACNNKETNRHFSDSRLSERALREIYLRGFEICVKESQPWTIMSSYNLVNGRRCAESYEQLQRILRDEWGFEGMITSDWSVRCDQAKLVLAGNDVRMPSGMPELLKEALKIGRIQRGHLEICVKRLLEMILKLD